MTIGNKIFAGIAIINGILLGWWFLFKHVPVVGLEYVSNNWILYVIASVAFTATFGLFYCFAKVSEILSTPCDSNVKPVSSEVDPPDWIFYSSDISCLQNQKKEIAETIMANTTTKLLVKLGGTETNATFSCSKIDKDGKNHEFQFGQSRYGMGQEPTSQADISQ